MFPIRYRAKQQGIKQNRPLVWRSIGLLLYVSNRRHRIPPYISIQELERIALQSIAHSSKARIQVVVLVVPKDVRRWRQSALHWLYASPAIQQSRSECVLVP